MKRKILLIEINEITWNLIDPLIAQGKLPAFARLKREGTWASPTSVDLPPQLDPWITWTTVYTGRSQQHHNVYYLQQPPDTIKAKRIWEILAERGLKVGVYGSLCSWPPQQVDGFYVPDTFSQDSSTWPPELKAIQDVNLTYTRSVRLPADQDTLAFKLRLGLNLLKLGLRPSVMLAIARQLIRERLKPNVRWQRVSLQPLFNFTFFEQLYRKHRPQFASFHTNHVAHYQHTYWKAMQPDAFRPQETTDHERKTYGSAIEFGYMTADRMLESAVRLLDENTVMAVASSMGQKPYIHGTREGRSIAQLYSHERFAELLGGGPDVRILSTMSDQFNIYADAPHTREKLEADVRAIYVDEPSNRLFVTNHMESSFTVNIYPPHRATADSTIYFPNSPGTPTVKYSSLIYVTDQHKSGTHDPKGMLILYGAGIKAGVEAHECDNLDIAPTLLTLLGEEVPKEMPGRVLAEAFSSAVPVSVSSAVPR